MSFAARNCVSLAKIHLGRNRAEVGYGSAKQKYGARYERGMNKRDSGIFQKLPQPSPSSHVAMHGILSMSKERSLKSTLSGEAS